MRWMSWFCLKCASCLGRLCVLVFECFDCADCFGCADVLSVGLFSRLSIFYRSECFGTWGRFGCFESVDAMLHIPNASNALIVLVLRLF